MISSAALHQRIAHLEAELARRQQAEDSRQTQAEQTAREKALDGLYTFPEAGEGKWPLRVILAAFETAQSRHEHRDLRRQHDRTMLANPRLVRVLGMAFGQRISTGKSGDAFRTWFATEIVQTVVEIVQGNSKHTKEAE